MKKITAFLLTLVMVFAMAGCGEQKDAAKDNESAAGETIKVGAIFNLTGAQASLDGPSLNGFKLAAKEINAKGGVLGKQIEVISIDGKTDQTSATNAALKLAEEDKVVAMAGFSDSNYALAAGPTAQEAGIPFITTGATLPSLPEQVGDYFFLAPFGDDAQAYAAADYAVEKLGSKTAYILKDTAMDFTMNLAAYFEERFKKYNGEDAILLEDTFKTNDQDYSAQINRLKAMKTKPELLFISSGPSDCGIIVKQVREAGIDIPIISGDGFDTPLLIELGGEGANVDTYFATHTCLTNEKELVKNFVTAYQEEYSREPENGFAALGYDTMYLIADAIERANSEDPTAIRDAIAETQGFEAVTGTISYEPGNRVPKKSVSVLKVEDGKFAFVEEVTP